LFDEFKERYDAWVKSGPYEISVEINDDGTEQVGKVKRVKRFPEPLTCVVADIFHNLHSALDHLAFALATEIAGCPKDTKIYFPFASSKRDLDASVIGSVNVRTFTAPTGDFFRREQPYPGGKGEALYTLHHLNLQDKHRSVIDLHSADQVRVNLPHGRKWIQFGPHTPDEIEFARYPLGEKPEHDPKAICRVLISAVPRVRQHSLSTLGWYRHCVEELLNRAEAEFF
jgi:hypothetical protein